MYLDVLKFHCFIQDYKESATYSSHVEPVVQSLLGPILEAVC